MGRPGEKEAEEDEEDEKRSSALPLKAGRFV